MVTKALILAAGLGSRLQSLTENQPKTLVEVNGKAILHHQLISLSAAGITECVIAIGHKGSMIKERFGSQYESIQLHYIENALFATTNNIYSLYLLKDHLNQACLLLEGDVLVEDSILQDLISNEAPNIAVVDHVTAEADGTILYADSNHVTKMILKMMNKPYTLIGINEGRPGIDKRYGMDHSKITNRTGWRPFTDFDIGLRATVTHYLDLLT